MNKEESGELWGRIREEYIQSDLSLKKLSEKYGVSKRQLERRSAREGWPALRVAQGLLRVEREEEGVWQADPFSRYM